MILSGERMACIYLISTISLACLFHCYHKKYIPYRLMIITLAVLAILLYLMYFLTPMLFARHLTSIYHSIMHLEHTSYGQLWLSSLQLGLDNFWFGVGAGGYKHQCMQYMAYNATEWCNIHSHNIYLELFSEHGIIGLILGMAMLGSLIFYMYKAYRIMPFNLVATGILCIIVLRLFPIAVTSSLFKTWYALTFWFMIGCYFGIAQRKTHQRPCLIRRTLCSIMLLFLMIIL